MKFVNYELKESCEFIVNSGVPQASHLGPTLFLLFMNDIVSAIGDDVFISLFDDDLKMAMSIENINDSNKLQVAIDKFGKRWCKTYMMPINLEKCSIMSISRKLEKIDIDYSYGSHRFTRVKQ